MRRDMWAWVDILGAIVFGSILVVGPAVLSGCCPSETKPTKLDPTFDPFEEGKVAGRAGCPRDVNPYPDITINRDTTNFERAIAEKRQRWFSGHNTGVAESRELRLIAQPDR